MVALAVTLAFVAPSVAVLVLVLRRDRAEAAREDASSRWRCGRRG